MKNKLITNRIKKIFLGIAISILVTLIIHYFLVSNININPTMQVFIDFIIFYIIAGIGFRTLGLTKKREKKSIKRKKVKKKSVSFSLILITILIIHYFCISKININSTFQVFIDFIIFGIILIILLQIDELIKKRQIKK